jgi:hypothetical protein
MLFLRDSRPLWGQPNAQQRKRYTWPTRCRLDGDAQQRRQLTRASAPKKLSLSTSQWSARSASSVLLNLYRGMLGIQVRRVTLKLVSERTSVCGAKSWLRSADLRRIALVRVKGKKLVKARVIVDASRIAVPRSQGFSWASIRRQLGIGGRHSAKSWPYCWKRISARHDKRPSIRLSFVGAVAVFLFSARLASSPRPLILLQLHVL